jgi:hypothetical protein
MKQSKFHRDIQPLRGVKKWGIRVRGKWWVQSADEDAIYYKKADAIKDATEFNSLRIDKDKIYTVEEYVQGD